MLILLQFALIVHLLEMSFFFFFALCSLSLDSYLEQFFIIIHSLACNLWLIFCMHFEGLCHSIRPIKSQTPYFASQPDEPSIPARSHCPRMFLYLCSVLRTALLYPFQFLILPISLSQPLLFLTILFPHWCFLNFPTSYDSYLSHIYFVPAMCLAVLLCFNVHYFIKTSNYSHFTD